MAQGAVLLLPSFSVVLHPESDILFIHMYDPVVGDGHFVGVPAQVFDYLLWGLEGSLGIDDP